MEKSKLLKAVIEHSGMSLQEIAGIMSAADGYCGFTYYNQTNEFYDKYSDLIWEKLYELADDMGEENLLKVISGFGIANQVDDDKTFKNLLAWFALEESAREAGVIVEE